MPAISRFLPFMILHIGVVACDSSEKGVLKTANAGDVSLEVDSVGLPGAPLFPILVKLTNNTAHKVVLKFDHDSNGFKHQVKNLYVIEDLDTFYLGIDSYENYYVFNENAITPIMFYARFQEGKGYFNSFGQIDSVFKNARLEYHLGSVMVDDYALKEELAKVDTLLIPGTLEISTGDALIVREFLPGTFWLREKSLKDNHY